MDINNYRTEIDQINRDLVKLLDRRMRVSEKIAEYKRDNNLRIVDPVRERALLDKIADLSANDMKLYNRAIFNLILEQSCDHQRAVLGKETPLVKKVKDAIENTPKRFPESAIVACQGVQGAYSQQACDKFFKLPKIKYMKNFRGVFEAIDSGLCEYGVLPLENSTAGSVNQVYDLMMEYNFHIVKSMQVKISHCLLAKPGTKKSDIKEILSHEQALAQSDKYLKQFPNAKITAVENTAVAAKMVSESERNDVAALASRTNSDAYGLEILENDVQDQDNNYTRFICITKKIEVYPGANKTSIMMVLDHRPGSLYRALARFNAMDINMSKLESRPIPAREFEFMFYFDLEESVYSDAFTRMLSQLDEISTQFRYLGSYLEV